MKRNLALLLCLVMLLCMTACSNTGDPNSNVESSPSQNGHQHNHIYEATVEATCTLFGEATWTCSCGDTYTHPIPALGHDWGDWELETPAILELPGTDVSYCSRCNAPQTRERTANAITNAFYDGGLIRIMLNSYGTLSASSLLEYASREFKDFADTPVSAATIYEKLAQRFDISGYFDTELSSFLQERFGYDAENGTYTLHDYGDTASIKVLGYVQQGDVSYDVYYAFTPDDIDATLIFKVVLEYNKPYNFPNRYLSISRCDATPEDMVECPADEVYELSK